MMEIAKNLLSLILAFVYSFGCSVHGIDVSHRQGTINWEQVAQDNQNIKFAYVKVTEGATYHDPMYWKNITEASYAGIEVGAYHFFRMTSTPEAQFENFKRHIVLYRDYMTLRPVLDVETFDNKTSEQVKKAVDKFVRLMYNEWGIYPVIYGPDVAPSKMLSDYVNEHCLFFLGQPGAVEPKQPHAIWQYACRGKVKGISAQVDLNRLHRKTRLEDLRW